MSYPQFCFHFDRSLQAAAYLLKRAPSKELEYIHLLKMLYIADREYLAERGYPITGDRVVAMQYGPVLSCILSLIKRDAAQEEQEEQWHRFIQTTPEEYKVRLISDPGDGDLSRASLAKLDQVFERYGQLKPFQVVQLTHEFTEWQKNYCGFSAPGIPWWDILAAQSACTMSPLVEDQIKLQHHQAGIQKVCQ